MCVGVYDFIIFFIDILFTSVIFCLFMLMFFVFFLIFSNEVLNTLWRVLGASHYTFEGKLLHKCSEKQ